MLKKGKKKGIGEEDTRIIKAEERNGREEMIKGKEGKNKGRTNA